MHEICPHCGKVSGEESPRFCSGCGARMDGGSSAGYPGSPRQPAEEKNRMIAVSASSFLPGLGQVYNGEAAKGFALFILTIVGLVLLLLPGLLVWLYGMYDAYSVAGKMNSGEIPFRETRMLHVVLFVVFALVVIVIAILVLIAVLISLMTSMLGPLGADFNPMAGSNGLF
jgi:TM2 domain-containing membrane protein YozV